MTAPFSHLDAGTPEEVWLEDARMHRLPDLEVTVTELIVVAAHPDDETLGAAGLIQRIRSTGGRITVIVATDGEQSHPQSPTHTPRQLAARRRGEAVAAVASLTGDAPMHFLGIPDGAVREHRDRLTTALTEIVQNLGISHQQASQVLVAAPWSGDGHRDHRVTAEVVAEISGRRGFRHVGYPIWLWHWGTPDDLPWQAAHQLRLTREEADAKRHAVDLHRSQIAPLSSAAGDEAVIQPQMRAHFDRPVEVLVEETAAPGAASIPAGWFTDFYSRHQDPWGFETRWYEQRKRSILMSALPTRELGHVLEIGCATGLLTRELADRATSVTALDPVPAALEAARTRVDADRRVTFVTGSIPADWPDGTFDTIVFSEVGYYLSRDDLATTITRIEHSLSPDGCVIACHWRHPVAGYPQTGDAIHAALRASRLWESLVRHEEADFLLDVLSPRPARSVAQRERLI
jgi:LmbE family N-acetylglucosaminyl deacetylase/SAM-dependent methyltransferase